MKHSPRGFARTERVGSQICREASEIIHTQLKDPQMNMLMRLLTLTTVRVTRDYSHARIYYTVLGSQADIEAVSGALEQIKGWLRSQLAKRIRLRRIPELGFVYDESIEQGRRLTRLIDEAIGKSSPDS